MRFAAVCAEGSWRLDSAEVSPLTPHQQSVSSAWKGTVGDGGVKDGDGGKDVGDNERERKLRHDFTYYISIFLFTHYHLFYYPSSYLLFPGGRERDDGMRKDVRMLQALDVCGRLETLGERSEKVRKEGGGV